MAGPLRVLAVLSVIAATLAGGYLAFVSFRQEKDLSVGTIRLSTSPGHKGALDVYVPLVDWGARFEAIRLPARLRVDVRTIDRGVAQKVAQGAPLDVGAVRAEARDAIAAYLRELIAIVVAAGLALGLLTAFAVRHHHSPRLRWTIAAATTTAVGMGVALVVLLPPRGEIAKPQYYAYGADIPRALDAAATVQRSARALEQELDAQLVGLARLVTQPANRPPIEDRPRVDDRLRPAQQRARAADPRARGRRRARVLPRRPLRPRLAAGEHAARAGVRDRRPVRLRHGEPRLRRDRPAAGPRRRGRAHPPRAAQAGRRRTGRWSPR